MASIVKRSSEKQCARLSVSGRHDSHMTVAFVYAAHSSPVACDVR